MIQTNNVKYAIADVRKQLFTHGRVVDRQEWQGVRDGRPQTKVYEIVDVAFRVYVPEHRESWAKECEPNLPWAEDHFKERISREFHGNDQNPGNQYMNWPWYEQGVEEHKVRGKFSHTYMERFWPVLAGEYPHMRGIRFGIGDLQALIYLLQDRPYTRQAYLPIWFPEDLIAAQEEERVPCTLGYHFLAYPGPTAEDPPSLKMSYFMRSCDYFRYLRDDMYMAGRLLQHVAEKAYMLPTTLTVHIANLHIFEPEVDRLKQELDQFEKERLSGAF